MDLAKRISEIRKRKKYTQKELASRSGMTYASLKRFEQTGEISLQSLTKLAIALGIESEVCNLFANVPFQTIEELINGQS